MIRVLGDGNIVEKNVITEYVSGAGAWGSGISIQGGENNTVQLNRIIGYLDGSSTNNHGIKLDGATGNLIKKNTIKNCQNGIWLGFPNPASNNNIENNVISSTIRAAIDVGDECNENVIVYNHIWAASAGMYISGDGNGVHENIISDCGYRGIHLLAGASDGLPLIYVSMPSPTPGPTPSGLGTVVSGDYNGDGKADLAIFRAASGLWVVRGVTRVYFGGSDDLPVPGDYNGSGSRTPAVFRTSSGLWAVRSVTRIYFGSSDDRPVPADFNGSGADDIGIFRPSSGLWAVSGITRVYFGSSQDIPVTR